MDNSLEPSDVQPEKEDDIIDAEILMPVIGPEKKQIGACSVYKHQLSGSKFCVALAYETEVCKVCGIKHEEFKPILFDIGALEDGQLCLVAETLDDAKHLPGFIGG